jgi:hypothetical protein
MRHDVVPAQPGRLRSFGLLVNPPDPLVDLLSVIGVVAGYGANLVRRAAGERH